MTEEQSQRLNAAHEYLESARFHFQLYKKLGEGALRQLDDTDFRWQPNEETNSVQIVLQHLHGNMLSRWTDFLTSDGEKPWRDRDAEFVLDESLGRDALWQRWDEGWACLFAAIDGLAEEDLTRDVRIRGQRLSVIEAMNRQMTHVAYHVGQIVQTAKERLGADWETLSIPRGASANIEAITKQSDRYRGTYDD